MSISDLGMRYRRTVPPAFTDMGVRRTISHEPVAERLLGDLIARIDRRRRPEHGVQVIEVPDPIQLTVLGVVELEFQPVARRALLFLQRKERDCCDRINSADTFHY